MNTEEIAKFLAGPYVTDQMLIDELRRRSETFVCARIDHTAKQMYTHMEGDHLAVVGLAYKLLHDANTDPKCSSEPEPWENGT